MLVLPADMPFVKSETVRAVIDGAGAVVAPQFNGRHGHPVALPAAMRDEKPELRVPPSGAHRLSGRQVAP